MPLDQSSQRAAGLYTTRVADLRGIDAPDAQPEAFAGAVQADRIAVDRDGTGDAEGGEAGDHAAAVAWEW